jgi:hypothetical protein
MPPLKKCELCKNDKSIIEFKNGNDELFKKCLDCRMESREKNATYKILKKICKKCKTEKCLQKFKNRDINVESICYDCKKEYSNYKVMEYGKIYKITSQYTNSIYIGSTNLKYLFMRMDWHINDYIDYITGKSNRYIASYNILKYDDVKISILEEYPTINRAELIKREKYWINKYENCCNIQYNNKPIK